MQVTSVTVNLFVVHIKKGFVDKELPLPIVGVFLRADFLFAGA